jgi:LuxR family maltose regulon positive regulatory protein
LCEAVQFGFAELHGLGSTQAASSREAQAGESGLSGQAYLDWLEASDLFVVALDDKHEWYRYHHLFQQLLRNQLQRRCKPDEIAALHARASAWYAENDLLNEALSHALSAGDDFRAANLLERNVRTLLNEDQWHIVRKWLVQLPAEIVQQRPELLLAKAWMANYQLDVKVIPGILESSEVLLDDSEGSQPLKGQIDFFRGNTLLWQGQASRSLELLNRALVRIPEAYQMARGETEIIWSLASQMVGQSDKAVRFLHKRLHDEQATHPSSQSRLLAALSYVHCITGELTAAAAAAQRLEKLGAECRNLYVQAWGSYLQAHLHYCWNDLENAAHHFANAVEQRYSNSVWAAIDSLAGSGFCYQALGRPDQAQAMMAQLLEFGQDMNVPTFINIALSSQARLSLMQGDRASAVRWLPAADLTTDTGPMFFWLEVPRLTQCRVLIALGSEAGLQEAVDKLQRYAQEVKAQNNTFQLVHILLLQAVAYHKKEQTDRALAALERAVTLAEGGGFIRPFVEVALPIAALLEELLQQGVVPEYVGQILAAFPMKDDAGASIRGTTGPELVPSVARPLSTTVGDATGGLVEPFTKRELEVLELMAQRLTNKEIADRLVLSVGTVKQHAYNINQKLNVRGRRQAVAKAISLGILSSS